MPKTKQQIAEELGISVSTLYRRLKAERYPIKRTLIFEDEELLIKDIILGTKPQINVNRIKKRRNGIN
jgi:hypothetical protein